MLRRALLPVIAALAVAVAGVAATPPAPAAAHKVACAAKRGKAKRACAKRASAHSRTHRSAVARGKKPKPPAGAPALVPAPAPVAAPAPAPDPVVPTAAPIVAAVIEPAVAAVLAPVITPTPAPAPVVAPAPAPAPAVTTWRSAGAQPLSDAEAAAGVRPVAESRPGNAAANAYRPTAAELDLFRNGETDRYGRTALQYNPLTARVTGAFSGSTDEILQWVARKWGIPEDVVRAVAANESWWSMSQLGDLRDGVYESLGIMQIKWRAGALHPGTDPLRWKSTAFNADYWGAVVRYYYDGLCYWCGDGYAAGQAWNSIGAWYNPSPWGAGSQTYQDHVRERLAQRPWTQAGF